MKTDEICARCLKHFQGARTEDLYESDWGVIWVCKDCIGPMAREQLGYEAEN